MQHHRAYPVSVSRPAAKEAPAPPPPSALSPAERRILTAIAGAAMPAGTKLPGANATDVERTERYLMGVPSLIRGYRALLWSFEAYAYLRYRRSIAHLDDVQLAELLESWQQGGLVRRNALRALVTPLKVAHYNDPAFYQDIGCVYSPPVVREERPRWMSERMLSAADVAGETIECDVVVIGTGAGGAVVAKELAERGLAVVMLEEGEYFGRADFNGRAVELQQKLYRDLGATFSVGNSPIWIPLGKTVGGSTTINSGTCFRTPERVFETWRTDHGLTEFSSETMAPYYERVESILGVAPVKPRDLGGVARVIARGCDVLGYAHKALQRNAPDCDGQGLCCFGCPTDAKRSTNVSYVPMALQRGATLVKGIRAEKILVEKGRAVGVVAREAKTNREVTARGRAVVVACGSLLTPVFLARNKLANSSGQLGRNLSIHPATGAIALFDETLQGFNAVPQGYSIEEFHDEGLLFEGAFAPPDLGSAGITMVGRRFVEVMDNYDRMACFGFMIEDTSRGRVRPGPGGRPLITYFVNDHDVARLKRGVEILSRVYFAAGATAVFPMIHRHEELRGEDDLERLRRARLRARDFDLSAFHPLGTARMGLSSSSSVVDTELQSHDVPGLYIIDGSVVPSSLAVNPQVTIMALATRAADRMAARLG